MNFGDYPHMQRTSNCTFDIKGKELLGDELPHLRKTVPVQFVVDSRHAPTKNDYSILMDTPVEKAVSIRLKRVLIPNENADEYAVVEVNDYYDSNLQGSGPVFGNALHVSHRTLGESRDDGAGNIVEEYFTIPQDRPYVFRSPVTINRLRVRIRQPDGDLFTFTKDHVLVFEIERAY